MDTSTDPSILEILKQGVVTLKGEFVWGSNYTFLVDVTHAGHTVAGVYKPTQGERPLWDFPAASLARREAAAYVVSQALGWGLVPPTVYRKIGPFGAGSVQLYVEHDPEYHYFNFTSEDIERLRPVVIFDLLINNADRKGSHILKDPDDHLWLIDHGVCFHVEDKLRTVIWNFVGETFPEELRAALANFQQLLGAMQDVFPTGENHESLKAELLCYLSQPEVRGLGDRARKLVREGVFPAPDPNRRPFPWPQI